MKIIPRVIDAEYQTRIKREEYVFNSVIKLHQRLLKKWVQLVGVRLFGLDNSSSKLIYEDNEIDMNLK